MDLDFLGGGVSPLSPDAGTQNNPSLQSDVPAPQGITAQSASSPEATGTSLLPFAPTYDADGNMTLIRTSTGTWTVEYNGENRPVTWTKSTGEKICMMYDAQGRRVEKRVLNAAGVRTLRERCVYVGYTCVQVLNGDNGNAVVKEFAWDPTEPVATRPLMFKYVPNGVTMFYAFDGNKNVSDVFCWAVQNGVPAHYEYAPFGAVTRTAKNTPFTLDLLSLNPWRFSSEFYDSELDLIYYNYRHYSPLFGRFLSRDPIEEQGGLNLYMFCRNTPELFIDVHGGFAALLIGGMIGGSFLMPILIGVGVGIAVGAVVVGSAILIGQIIGSLPQTESAPEEETKVGDDAISIPQCPPCPEKKKRCAPCDPPAGTVMFMACHTDHYHGGMKPHYHYHRVNQNKETCACFENRNTPYTTAEPIPGAIPCRNVSGGGYLP